MPDVARRLAFEVLWRVDEEGELARDALDGICGRVHPDARDRDLASEIALGVLRREETIDAILALRLKRPRAQQDRNVMRVLRIGAYQLLFLDRVPPHAAISTAVELARDVGLEQATGAVNAILRSFEPLVLAGASPREGDPRRSVPRGDGTWLNLAEPVFADPRAFLAGNLALRFGVPVAAVERWLRQHGEAAVRQILAASIARPPVSVRRVGGGMGGTAGTDGTIGTAGAGAVGRVAAPETPESGLGGDGPGSGGRESVNGEDDPGLDRDRGAAERPAASEAPESGPADDALGSDREGPCVLLRGTGDVRSLPDWQAGRIVVQDATSAEVALFLAPSPGSCVLDVCAAPGGKSLGLAEQVGPAGRIVAVDVPGPRTEKMRAELVRRGVTNVDVVTADATDASALPWRPADAAPSPGSRATADVASPPSAGFDLVLVDAPCSNSGVLAKRVEARRRLHDGEALASLVALQSRLIVAAATRVRPGGRLAWSTCSIDDEENGARVRAFLSGRVEFRFLSERTTLPVAGRRDGGYLAVMERVSDPARPGTT